jgi:uncharacterized protein (DUF488 family)
MTTYENRTQFQNREAVYTLGIGRMKPEELKTLLARFHIEHVFDVRGDQQQRVPADLRPPNLTKIVSRFGATYHNEAKPLGHRSNYQLFALTDEFMHSVQPMVEAAKRSNILIICAEADYRKCHRKLVASFLSRNGFLVRHIGKDLPTSFQPTLETSANERPLGHRVFTIGFTKKSMREFAGILRDARIGRVVDIRLRPISQYSGFARKDDLEFLLELMRIEYIHALDLAPTPPMLDGYRTDSDWTKYEREFRRLLNERKPDALLRQLLSPGVNVVLLCTEDTPERCHRRLVSDYAKSIMPDLEIIHLTSRGSFEAGSLPRNLESVGASQLLTGDS